MPRGREPGQGAFADQLPLELGQRREDAEHEADGRRGGVDLRALPGEHPQAHAAGRQVLHGVDQVGEGAAQAVELPDDEHVARPERAHTAVESRPVVADAGREVVVDVDGVDALGPQRVALQVQRWEPSAFETRASPISMCRKRSFATGGRGPRRCRCLPARGETGDEGVIRAVEVTVQSAA